MLARMPFDVADLDRFRPSGTPWLHFFFLFLLDGITGKKREKPKFQERLYNMSTARTENKLETRKPIRARSGSRAEQIFFLDLLVWQAESSQLMSYVKLINLHNNEGYWIII